MTDFTIRKTPSYWAVWSNDNPWISIVFISPSWQNCVDYLKSRGW